MSCIHLYWNTEKKNFTDGEFIKKCAIEMAKTWP